VVTTSANPLGIYYAEILRNEGINLFSVADISTVTATTLASYDLVILAEMPLTSAQVSMFTNWVNGGGRLIAMRPDKQLASMLGIADAGSTLANAYLLVNTASGPGVGIVNQTIQFHGTADLYALNGATSVATLYSDASTATLYPAVTLVSVGPNGGEAAAFAYDLARSVVYTRQGNPAWSGQARDSQSPIRPDNLFFGAASFDLEPDWVNLNKVAIPQADEQQRLLANLILSMNSARKPLPRFWYFPRAFKAVIVMTGDDHGNGGTPGRFDSYISQSAPGCSVANWECIRSTSYIYTESTFLTNAQAASYNSQGFEIAAHISTNCGNWTPSTLASFYSTQISNWKAVYPSLPSPVTNRTHCLAWSDYATQPQVEFNNGIRLDTTYYYWPSTWILDRPGMFTGSGMPMRFTDINGNLLDVYQATTQITDESGESEPLHVNTLLDNALGSLGYYGAFTVNAHTDNALNTVSDAVVSSAQARQVPIVSGRQMLNWLDGRNASSFGALAWDGRNLSFTIAVGAGAAGLLQAMVPTNVAVGSLSGITLNGASVAFTKQTIKGNEYAFFAAQVGSYVVSYAPTATGPVISNVTTSSVTPSSAVITWTTDSASDTQVEYGTTTLYGSSTPLDTLLVNSHSKTLSGLTASTTYHYRVKSRNGAGVLSVSGDFLFTTLAIDITPPTISNVSASVITNVGATIGWTTDEPSDSQVEYGLSTTYGSSTTLDPTLVTNHTVTLSGLSPDTVYHYRVKSRDFAGNLAVSGDFTFRTQSGVRTDTTVSDFTSGTRDASTYVSQTTDGELILAPTVGAEFSGTTLPAGWTSTAWFSGGTGTVGNGVLSVVGAHVGTSATFARGRSLEFVATFSGNAYQGVGFGIDFNSAPWAMFSTNVGGALYAQTNTTATGTSTDTLLPGNWIGAPHRFRIDWNQNSVVYWIDGTQVIGHAITLTDVMRPLVSDYNGGGGKVTVDWLRMTPYAASATFTSRVMVAPSAVSWGTVLWTSDTSGAGTSLAISVRTGNTPTPDSTWTTFVPLASSGTVIGTISRYLQYRAQLATTNPNQTPVLNDISFFFTTALTADFALGASPASQTISPGASTPYTVTVTAQNGFSGTVSFSASGLPTGASASFSPATITGSGSTTMTVTTAANSPPGSYPVTITATSGSLVHTAGVTLNLSNFSLAASPASQSVTPGAGTSYTVSVGALNGFGGTVSFSASGLPSGAGATFTPTTVTGSGSTTMNVTTAANTPPGSYTVTITGTSGSLQHTAQVTLNVTDFSLSASPASRSINQVQSTTYTVSVTALGGFSGVASFAASGLPSGAGASFSPTTVTGTGSTTMNVTTAANTPAGSYTLTITGTSGLLQHTAQVSLTVNAVPDFTVGASPASQTVIPGAGTSYTVTIGVLNGFSGTVSFSASGLPSGAGATFTPATVTGSGSTTMNVTTAANTPGGSYTVTITGTSGSLLHTAQVTLNVPPHTTITANPPALSNSTNASFSFTSTEANSTFQCSLDGAAFSACSTPQSYTNLTNGSHTFQVRAIDPAGNTDPTPASYTWTIDTAPPKTSITSSPPSLTSSTSASFSFTSTKTGSTFQCSLDGAAFSACSTPQSYTNLTNGSHTFQVRAIDPAGNIDPTPASYTWTVDTVPPVISNVSASSITRLSAAISWTTNKLSDSQVEYGTTTAYGTLTPLDLSLVTSHQVTLTGLLSNTLYHYRVRSHDAVGNLSISGDFTFTTTAATLSDTTVADFAAGTPDANTYISQTTDGEVILAPTVGAEFSGTSLTADWSVTAWSTGGTGTVGNGVLTVDGALAGTIATYGPGRSLEFVATFSGDPYQHVGFGTDFTGPPWAIFSTLGGGALYARTSNGDVIDTQIPGNWLGAPHRFRIDWSATSVVYWIDGTQVASHALTITTAMRPLVSDYIAGNGMITVDWLRLTPYAASATFLSRVFDASSQVKWGTATWTSDTSAAGTSIVISVRTGNTATPDATWTAFVPLASSGTVIGTTSRYLQYRAQLATTNPDQTPVLKDLTIGFSTP
jgi:uncharacterized membrane protein